MNAKTLINYASEGDTAKMKDAIDSILAAKATNALDTKRVEVARNMLQQNEVAQEVQTED
jgi:hypothetical protein